MTLNRLDPDDSRIRRAVNRTAQRARLTALGGLALVVVNVLGVAADGNSVSDAAKNGVPVTFQFPTPNPIVPIPPRWGQSGQHVDDIHWPGPPDVVVNQAGRDDRGQPGAAQTLPPVLKTARSSAGSRLLPNVAAPTGGTPGPAGSPAIAVAATRASGQYAKGEAVSFTITVSNPTASAITVTNVTDLVPSGYLPAQASDLWMDNVACTATTSPPCTLDATTKAFTVGSFALAASAQHVFSLAMVANPTFLDCKTLQNTATATDAAGTSSAWVTPSICDGGLGVTPWWTMWSTATGPQAQVSVLAANGNVVASQTDSTRIPLHGKLSLGLSRTFNALDTGDGEPTSPLGRGWIATFDRVGAGSPQDPNTLSIPVSPAANAAGAESYASPYPVTMIDSTGNRQVFVLTTLPTPIDVTALAGTTGPLGSLVPRVLTRDTGFGRVCIDAAATSPAAFTWECGGTSRSRRRPRAHPPAVLPPYWVGARRRRTASATSSTGVAPSSTCRTRSPTRSATSTRVRSAPPGRSATSLACTSRPAAAASPSPPRPDSWPSRTSPPATRRPTASPPTTSTARRT